MKRSWRDLYIRLLNEGPTPVEKLSDEERGVQALLADELIESGHANGLVVRSIEGEISKFAWEGPTTQGRLLADRLSQERNEESFSYKLKQAGIGLIGWLSGVASAYLIWWITK